MPSAGSDRYDFSNPFLSAVIVTRNGRFPLWTSPNKIKTVSGADKGYLALSYLAELVVEIQLAYLPRITATLTPPYREAINFLDSDLMNWGVTELEVMFGYISPYGGTILSPAFTGVLVKPEVSLGSDVTITLTAQGMGGLSASQQAGTRTFNNNSRIDIIRAIAEGRTATTRKEELVSSSAFRLDRPASYNTKIEPLNLDQKETFLDPRLRSDRLPLVGSPPNLGNVADSLSLSGQKTRDIFVDDSAVKDGKDEKSKDRLYNEPIVYVQGGKSDWRAIWELAAGANCYFVWENKTLKLFPQNLKFTGGSPARHFRLYDYPGGEIGPANGYFPILSASSPDMAVYLPGAAKGLHARGVDERTRELRVLNVNDSTEKIPRMGDGGGAPSFEMGYAGANDETGDGQATHPGEADDGDVKKQMQHELDRVSGNMGVNLTLESLADPKLKPGDVISVTGLGFRLSRNYWVTKVTYTFGGGGSTMNLESVSNSAPIESAVRGHGLVAKVDKEPSVDDGVTKEATEGGV